MRTEHDALVKSMTKIFSNFVAFSENPNFMIQLAFTEQLIPCHVHQRAKLAVFGWTEKIGTKFNYTKRKDCGIKLANGYIYLSITHVMK